MVQKIKVLVLEIEINLILTLEDGIFSKFRGGGDNGEILNDDDNTRRQRCISCGGVGCIYVLHNMVLCCNILVYNVGWTLIGDR